MLTVKVENLLEKDGFENVRFYTIILTSKLE